MSSSRIPKDAYDRAVRSAISEYNSDLSMNAWITLGVGIVTTLVLFFVVWWLVWLFGPRWLGGWLPMLAGLAAVGLGVFGVWRGDSPLDGLRPLSDAELNLTVASMAVGGVMYANPKHVVANVAEFVLHGPRSMLQGIGLLRTRLPSDDGTIRAAAEVFERGLNEPVPVESVRPPKVAVLLHRLLLLKMQQVGRDKYALVSTIKGQEALGAAARA